MKYVMLLMAEVATAIFSIRKIQKLIETLLWKQMAKRTPEEALRLMLNLDAFISKYTHLVAIEYNGGEHPCHDILNYKQFYIDQVKPDDVVLDVGSHEGDIAFAVANGSGAKVIGIELLRERHEKAVRQNSHPLITFHCGDALTLPIEEKVTVIILSAILEHIVDRDTFLKTLVARYQPEKILIRVPMFTREWRVPMRKQLGMNYFMDSTHYIEYTLPEFKAEMAEANLNIESMQIEWGEIWAVCKPAGVVQSQTQQPAVSAAGV